MKMGDEKIMDNKDLNLHLLKYLLISYMITAILLIIMSFLLYWFDLSSTFVSIGIIVIYVVSCLLSGMLAGSRAGHHRFLYGLLMGTAYFLLLTLISMIAGGDGIEMDRHFFTVLCLCCGGGMLGGMLSK